jgi:hypothetical protein
MVLYDVTRWSCAYIPARPLVFYQQAFIYDVLAAITVLDAREPLRGVYFGGLSMLVRRYVRRSFCFRVCACTDAGRIARRVGRGLDQYYGARAHGRKFHRFHVRQVTIRTARA